MYSIKSANGSHVTIVTDGTPRTEPKAEISYSILQNTDEKDIASLSVSKELVWFGLQHGQIINGSTEEAFESMDDFDAFMKSILANSSTTPSATIVISADGNTISNPVFVGRSVSVIVINDIPKNTGFTIDGDTLTFTDETTVTAGQSITIIFS